MVSTLLNASPQAKLTAAGNEVGIITNVTRYNLPKHAVIYLPKQYMANAS
jgi:hypothetical protein